MKTHDDPPRVLRDQILRILLDALREAGGQPRDGIWFSQAHQKILPDLHFQGFIEWVDGPEHGWVITPAGVRELERTR